MVMTNISDKDSEGGARLTSEKYSLKPLACAIGSGRLFFTDFDFNSTSWNIKPTDFIQEWRRLTFDHITR